MTTRISLFLSAVVLTLAGWPAASVAEPADARHTNVVRIQLVPEREASLSSGAEGLISDIAVKEGQAFKRGDVLFRQDCRLEAAQKRRVLAELGIAEQKLDVMTRLDSLNSVSQLDKAIASGEQEKWRAEADIIEAKLELCVVRAPFDGKVVELHMSEHEWARPGDVVIDIVSSRPPLVEMIVPSHALSTLSVGDEFALFVDELSASFDARIVSVGARIDPVSQSVEVSARILEPTGKLIPGMTGEARFDSAR